MYSSKSSVGFSLPELLITLAITGVLAALTIPAFLQSNAPTNGSAKQTAMAREAAFMITNAYEQFKAANPNFTATSTTAGSLTPYMNYVATDSSSLIDYCPTLTTVSCATYRCLKLHNGGKLLYDQNAVFPDTSTTSAIYFYFDPDGVVTDGTTNGPGKSIVLWLRYDGKIQSWGSLSETVYYRYFGVTTAIPRTSSYEPTWFSGF